MLFCLCVFHFCLEMTTELNDTQRQALERAFDDPESPFQYATPTALHCALRHTHPELGPTLKKVRNFVERRSCIHQIVQVVRRRHYDRRLTMSRRPDHQFQCDLAYFRYGKRFVLTKVDTFSRLANAEVVANKSWLAVLCGFCKISNVKGRLASYRRMRAKNFSNVPFRHFCDENGIEHFNTNSETKASMVEQFNRTLGTLLERRVRSNKGISLQRALRTEIDYYNRRPSSMFGFCWSPRQVHDDDGPYPGCGATIDG